MLYPGVISNRAATASFRSPRQDDDALWAMVCLLMLARYLDVRASEVNALIVKPVPSSMWRSISVLCRFNDIIPYPFASCQR